MLSGYLRWAVGGIWMPSCLQSCVVGGFWKPLAPPSTDLDTRGVLAPESKWRTLIVPRVLEHIRSELLSRSPPMNRHAPSPAVWC